jgi:V-type H+-transporting ATPase subunit E
MDAQAAQQRIKSMIDLIRKEAEEKAEMIKTQADAQFSQEKNKILNQQKDKIITQYRTKLDQYIVQRRIDRSTKINKARLEKMTARHEVTMKIREETRQKLTEKFQKDKREYADLLKKMIVQGMIKLMEKDIQIRARKDDIGLVEPILDDCAKLFKEVIKKETGVDFPVNLTLDKNNLLNENLVKIGGVVLAAHRGKILCTNTIDTRLDLCFQDSIPDIREKLFPDLTKPIEPVKVAPKQHHH